MNRGRGGVRRPHPHPLSLLALLGDAYQRVLDLAVAELIDTLVVVDCVLARSAVHVVGRLRHVWCVWVFRIAAIVVVAHVDAVVVVAAVELDLPFAVAAYVVYAVATRGLRSSLPGPP